MGVCWEGFALAFAFGFALAFDLALATWLDINPTNVCKLGVPDPDAAGSGADDDGPSFSASKEDPPGDPPDDESPPKRLATALPDAATLAVAFMATEVISLPV